MSSSKDINVQNNYGNGDTALHQAAYYDRVIDVKQLLAAGADTNIRNYYGYTALHKVICGNYRILGNSRVQIVKLLLDAGADPNIKNSLEKTALHLAASSPSDLTKVAKLLLEAGGDPKIKNKCGNTPLDTAIYYARYDMINLLEFYSRIVEWRPRIHHQLPEQYKAAMRTLVLLAKMNYKHDYY